MSSEFLSFENVESKGLHAKLNVKQVMRKDLNFVVESEDVDYVSDAAYYRTWHEEDGTVGITIHPYSIDCLNGEQGVWVSFLFESSIPMCFDCPLEIIEVLSEPESEMARDWREAVRIYHKNKNWSEAESYISEKYHL